jgi:antitoxin PrlF
MKAKVTQRGQVTIPKLLRERLGVKPGTVLDFTEENDRLIAVKAAPAADPISAVYGCLGKRFHTDAFVREIRGKI